MKGYGRTPPDPKWPGKAQLAVQFVLNYEEGGENSILHGDAASEAFLSEMVGAAPLHGVRHMSMESLYEYGSRAGFWRLMRIFAERELPLTVFAVGMALERNPEAAAAMVEAGHEVAGHGWRWIDYQYVPMDIEREHMARAIETIKRLTGKRPFGWYTGRTGPNTLKLVAEHAKALYCADSYADDLPYWLSIADTKLLMVPYTLDANDMRFATAQGFNSGEQFYAYLKASFDQLYREGERAPKMMSVGLHCRLAGRPGRAEALARFLDYVQGHERVWVCRRVQIARHWRKHHKPRIT
ncbi:MAG: allantoinase PuuE [Alphaproteobacteria bacterium]